MDDAIEVILQPSGRRLHVARGSRLADAVHSAGATLPMSCGGAGVCGKCRLQVARGASPATAAEERAFSPSEIAAGWRLACQMSVEAATTVVLPADAHAKRGEQILARSAARSNDAASNAQPPHDAPLRKVFLTMPAPKRGDDAPDGLRLERALRESGALSPGGKCAAADGSVADTYTADLELLQQLGERLREGQFAGTAALAGRRLVDFEIGDTSASAFAAAIDLGTTTIVGSLLECRTGSERAVSARINPQTRFGDDVLSRIMLAVAEPDGLGQLREVVVAAVQEILDELCAQAGIPRETIYSVALAGNTTMQHLFCGIRPWGLATVPFTPTLASGLSFPLRDAGLRAHPRGEMYVLPVIGGFVGGDTVAGILATGITESAGPTLLVDIGTNGEIVLWSNGTLRAASTAAGPAFEGARISQGMRGVAGAIERVEVCDGRLRIRVIGSEPPRGICGSGLIDAAAELLRHGAMNPQGRLAANHERSAIASEDLRRRMVDGSQPEFLLAEATAAHEMTAVRLTQRDLRELQLASGAIRAGIALLLREAGLSADDLQEVIVAGGFGNYVRCENAQRIGLLPPSIARERISYQGNTSLAGAQRAALSLAARQRAETIARQAQHVELSILPDFRDVFADAMIFPEG